MFLSSRYEVPLNLELSFCRYKAQVSAIYHAEFESVAIDAYGACFLR